RRGFRLSDLPLNHNISALELGRSAARRLGRSKGRHPARWEPWWWSHRGLCGGADVAGPGPVFRLPLGAGRWIGHVNPSMSLRTVCQLRDVEAVVGAQAVSD